jgi:hypothetical protein
MRTGDIIKHNRFMDACIKVLSIRSIGDKYVNISGTWWNQGFNNSYQITPKPINFNITSENKKDWSILKNKEIPCFRYGNWEVLDEKIKE